MIDGRWCAQAEARLGGCRDARAERASDTGAGPARAGSLRYSDLLTSYKLQITCKQVTSYKQAPALPAASLRYSDRVVVALALGFVPVENC